MEISLENLYVDIGASRVNWQLYQREYKQTACFLSM